ncbi:MAG: cell division protein FtsA, partial [Candidatus Magasanikbacteria bacterium]
MSDIITGLDIGSSTIKGVVVERDSSGEMSVVNAFDTPSKGFRKGVLVDEEEAAKVFQDVVEDLEQISSQAAKRVFLNVNGEHVRPRSSEGIVAVSRADQEIQKDDVERVNKASRAIKQEDNYEILHNIIAEYFVDDVGEIKDPVGMTGSRLKVETLIVESFSPHTDKVVRTFQKAGGEVRGVVFTPLAASKGILTKRQKNLGVLSLDIGDQTTSFVVYEEGKVVYTKSIPVGSGFVTNDIAIGLKIPVELAEKLKRSYGYAL